MSFPLPHELLPHRYPFLLLDRVTQHPPGALRAIKCVTYNEPYFVGHFPSSPIVPGVILIEIMAQASAALYRLEHPSETLPMPGKLAAVDRARFHVPVYPGTQLIVNTKLVQAIGALARFEATISMDDTLVASAVLTLVSPVGKLPSDSEFVRCIT
jgi:3-hydroxyacyl-[acyl-carrier-protein] dehydratase